MDFYFILRRLLRRRHLVPPWIRWLLLSPTWLALLSACFHPGLIWTRAAMVAAAWHNAIAAWLWFRVVYIFFRLNRPTCSRLAEVFRAGDGADFFRAGDGVAV